MTLEEGSVLAVSEDLVESPTHKAAGTISIDFEGLLQPPLRLQENLANGNGGQAWPAGMVLARYLLKKKEEIKSGSIVELGSGSGLVGLAIAVGCIPHKTIHITDQEPMLALMHHNIELNNLVGKVEAKVYDWGQERPDSVPEHPDILLAADCVYFEPAFPLLQQTLQDLIGARTVCYFCFKKRRRADLHFMKAVRKMFLVEAVEDDPDCDAYTRESIFLYTIRRKPDR